MECYLVHQDDPFRYLWNRGAIRTTGSLACIGLHNKKRTGLQDMNYVLIRILLIGAVQFV
jgi:hypothetical protein